ncbi:hypothetical protein ABZ215_25230 [Amycolatopsis sp. NPDC006131]|uniref:hypothetical protein n=1 Tax=Amycolatopsis sp. NPDC006131 TaxID=3156731 RepID=UPI0033BA90CC
MSVDYDWGVPADVLKSKSEIFDLPEEVAKRREERLAAAPPHLEPPEPAAVEAVVAEVDGTGVRFEFDGEFYLIEPMDEWDLDVFEAEARPWDFARLLMGEVAYERFKTEPDPERPGRRRKKPRKLKDINAWIAAASAAAGTEPGE